MTRNMSNSIDEAEPLPNLQHHSPILNQSHLPDTKKKSETSLEHKLEFGQVHHAATVGVLREPETPSHSRIVSPFIGTANRTRILENSLIDTGKHQQKLDFSTFGDYQQRSRGFEIIQQLINRRYFQVLGHFVGSDGEEARKYFATARAKIRTVNLMSSPKNMPRNYAAALNNERSAEEQSAPAVLPAWIHDWTAAFGFEVELDSRQREAFRFNISLKPGFNNKSLFLSVTTASKSYWSQETYELSPEMFAKMQAITSLPETEYAQLAEVLNTEVLQVRDLSVLAEHFRTTAFRLKTALGRSYRWKKQLDPAVEQLHRLILFERLRLKQTTRKTTTHVQLSKLFYGPKNSGAVKPYKDMFREAFRMAPSPNLSQSHSEHASQGVSMKSSKRRERRMQAVVADRLEWHTATMSRTELVEGSFLNSTSSSLALKDVNLDFGVFMVHYSNVFYRLKFTLQPSAEFLGGLPFSHSRDDPPAGWIDQLRFEVTLFNKKMRQEYLKVEIPVSSLVEGHDDVEVKRFYRSFVFGKPTLYSLQVMRTYLKNRLFVHEDRVSFSANKLPTDFEMLQKHLRQMQPSWNIPDTLVHKPTKEVILDKKALHRSKQVHITKPKTKTEATYLRQESFAEKSQKLYFQLVFCGKFMRFAFEYTNYMGQESLYVHAVDSLTEEQFVLVVKDGETLARLSNLLTKLQSPEAQESIQFKKVALNLFMSIKTSNMGSNLVVNSLAHRLKDLNQQSTAYQLKYNMISGFETVFLANHFMKKVVRFSHVHPHLGRLFVIANVYYSYKLPKKQCVMVLTLVPTGSLFCTHKLILNATDLKEFFAADAFEMVKRSETISSILARVVSKTVLVKKETYSQLEIPLLSVKNVVPNRNYVYTLKNQFDTRLLHVGPEITSLPYDSLLTHEFGQHSQPYLSQRIKSHQVMAKSVSRFGNQYYIITAKRNLFAERFTLSCYVPQVRRTFTCNIMTQDILGMSSRFRDKLMLSSESMLSYIESRAKNYQQFEELVAMATNKNLHDSRLPTHTEESSLKTRSFANASTAPGSRITNQPKQKVFALKKEGPGDSKLLKTETNQVSQKKSFATSFSWLKLLAECKLVHKNRQTLLQIDEFKAVLKEKVWQSICVAGEQLFELELHLEPRKKTISDRVERFNSIPIKSLVNYHLLLRLDFIGQARNTALPGGHLSEKLHGDKISLYDLYHIYQDQYMDHLLKKERSFNFGESTVKPRRYTTRLDSASMTDHKDSDQTDQKLDASEYQSEEGIYPADNPRQTLESPRRQTTSMPQLVSLSQLIDLARILESKIVENIESSYTDVIQSADEYVNTENVISKKLIYKDKFERKMKLNSRMDFDIQLDPHYKEHNHILLYRSLFTLSPKQELVILYNKSFDEFSFVVYASESSKNVVQQVPAEKIMQTIPHLHILLENKKFTEVGRRIHAAYKNSLLLKNHLQSVQSAQPVD